MRCSTNGLHHSLRPATRAERRRVLRVLGSMPAFALPAWTGSAYAKSAYPTRTIRIICPYGAGSPVDIAGRYMAERLHAGFGQPVVVENLAGGGGTTGTAAVLRAAADGHTLLTQFTSALVTTGFLYKSVKYDVLKDFIPVWSLGSAGTVFVVSSQSPYQTLQQLIDAAKEGPGRITFASAGTGSTPHMNAEMFMRETGVKLGHVAYRSSAQATADMLGGHVDCLFASISQAAPLIRDGRLRGLAVLRAERVDELPEVPTLREAGVQGWEPPRSTFGLFAPAGTPRPVVEQLISTLNAAYRADDEGRERMKKIGLSGVVAGDELDALMHREYSLYRKLIDEVGIPPVG